MGYAFVKVNGVMASLALEMWVRRKKHLM
jgi:hypothetical protein